MNFKFSITWILLTVAIVLQSSCRCDADQDYSEEKEALDDYNYAADTQLTNDNSKERFSLFPSVGTVFKSLGKYAGGVLFNVSRYCLTEYLIRIISEKVWRLLTQYYYREPVYRPTAPPPSSYYTQQRNYNYNRQYDQYQNRKHDQQNNNRRNDQQYNRNYNQHNKKNYDQYRNKNDYYNNHNTYRRRPTYFTPNTEIPPEVDVQEIKTDV